MTGTAATATRAYVLAGLRPPTGFVFLLAFPDKTFGLGYATRSGSGWTAGGSPTKSFLAGVAVGPMESAFHDGAGAAWADRLFMLGLPGVGPALIPGVGGSQAAVAGTTMTALMDRGMAARPASVRRLAQHADEPVRRPPPRLRRRPHRPRGRRRRSHLGAREASARLPFVSHNPWLR